MDPRAATTGDRSRITLVIIWFLYLAAVFSVGARLGTKYAMARKLAWDDGLTIIAQVTFLGQCISISFAASSGLGNSIDTLDSEKINSCLKAVYASTPFLILTLALMKWSICVFINYLSPQAVHRRVDRAFRTVIGLWMVTGILVSLFQCATSTPWNYIDGAHCVNRLAWWAYVAIVNMVTEFGFILIFFHIIWNLQVSALKRTTILLVFLTRLLVIGAAAAQLAVFWTSYSGADVTKNLWLPTLCNQVLVFTSVLTACLPYLKPLMVSLESGVVRVPEEPEELAHIIRSATSAN